MTDVSEEAVLAYLSWYDAQLRQTVSLKNPLRLLTMTEVKRAIQGDTAQLAPSGDNTFARGISAHNTLPSGMAVKYGYAPRPLTPMSNEKTTHLDYVVYRGRNVLGEEVRVPHIFGNVSERVGLTPEEKRLIATNAFHIRPDCLDRYDCIMGTAFHEAPAPVGSIRMVPRDATGMKIGFRPAVTLVPRGFIRAA